MVSLHAEDGQVDWKGKKQRTYTCQNTKSKPHWRASKSDGCVVASKSISEAARQIKQYIKILYLNAFKCSPTFSAVFLCDLSMSVG